MSEDHEKFENGNAELLALQRLDESCIQLQKQGKYLEALECMERGLVLRQHFFGSESDEVWSACKTVGELCNLLAMTYLQQEDYNMVLELLKKAEILTERDPPSRAATFNNLACYYRRKGKLHSALQYLEKALKIESRLQNVQNPADTHINACAVLSQLGRHQQALEHAQNALILLQEELLTAPGVAAVAPEEQAPPQADRIAVLAIAYHNTGVEQEFLKRYDQSMMNYKKGFEVAERYLGAKHPICNTLKSSYAAAKKAAANAALKHTKPSATMSASSSSASSSPTSATKDLHRISSSSSSSYSPTMTANQNATSSNPNHSLSINAITTTTNTTTPKLPDIHNTPNSATTNSKSNTTSSNSTMNKKMQVMNLNKTSTSAASVGGINNKTNSNPKLKELQKTSPYAVLP